MTGAPPNGGREAILPLLPHLRGYARGLTGGDPHAADDADLLDVAVLERGEQRDHAGLEEVDGPDRLAGLEEGLPEPQLDGPEGGRYP